MYSRSADSTSLELTPPVWATYCHDGRSTAGLSGFLMDPAISDAPPAGGSQSSHPLLPAVFWQNGTTTVVSRGHGVPVKGLRSFRLGPVQMVFHTGAVRGSTEQPCSVSWHDSTNPVTAVACARAVIRGIPATLAKYVENSLEPSTATPATGPGMRFGQSGVMATDVGNPEPTLAASPGPAAAPPVEVSRRPQMSV